MNSSNAIPPAKTPGTNEAAAILVLGILGLFVQILGPVTWIWGTFAMRRADRSQVGLIQAGRVLGIIDTAILTLAVIASIAYYLVLVRPMATMINSMDLSAPTAAPAVHTHKHSHSGKPVPATNRATLSGKELRTN